MENNEYFGAPRFTHSVHQHISSLSKTSMKNLLCSHVRSGRFPALLCLLWSDEASSTPFHPHPPRPQTTCAIWRHTHFISMSCRSLCNDLQELSITDPTHLLRIPTHTNHENSGCDNKEIQKQFYFACSCASLLPHLLRCHRWRRS
jgi:hypothetical protein